MGTPIFGNNHMVNKAFFLKGHLIGWISEFGSKKQGWTWFLIDLKSYVKLEAPKIGKCQIMMARFHRACKVPYDDYLDSECWRNWKNFNSPNTTVDGRNPPPVDREVITLFKGFHTSQVVQDFFHQQYQNKAMALDDLDLSHDAIVSKHDFLGPKTRTHSLEETSFSVTWYS